MRTKIDCIAPFFDLSHFHSKNSLSHMLFFLIFNTVQMHEIGHNLNLAHSSGLDGREYSDHTCLMG